MTRVIKKIVNNKNIKIAAIGSLSIKFFASFFAFVNSILLARILGIEYFGIYVLTFATVSLLSIPVALGLPLLITRFVSKYEVENNYSAIKGLLIKSNQLVLVTTFIIALFGFISYFLWWKNLNNRLIESLYFGFFLIPLFALSSLKTAALRGLRYIILGQIPDTLLRNFIFFVGLIICYFIKFKLTPANAIVIHIIAASISFLVSSYFLKNKLLNKLKKLKPEYEIKKWIKEVLPFSINSGVQVIKTKLSTYILAIFGSLEAVALFDVAIRGSSLVAFSLDALNTAIAPYISKEFENNKINNIQKIVTKTTRLVFIFALPIVLIFIFGGKKFIQILYGKEYILSYIPLIIICIGQLVNAATGSVGLVLNMTSNQVHYTKIIIKMAVLNVILSIPLIIYFDVIGAAILYSVILVIQNLSLVIYVKKKLSINTTIF